VTAFRFRAARADGEPVVGVLDATTGAAAAHDLAGRGLFAVEVREVEASGRGAPRGSPADLAALFSGLAALLEAGLPLDRALAAAEESSAPALRAAIAEARRRVREGASLSAALDGARVAPDLALGLLRAGEAHGRLAESAARAAAELERQADLRAQLRAALAYPAFLAVVGTASVGVIMAVVVPRFAALLGDLGGTLPASTRLLLALSDALVHRGVVLIAAAGVAAVAAARALATDAGRLTLHRRLLALPIVGPIRHSLASARACRALAGLLESGLPLLPALDLARQACGDRAVAERLRAARASVGEGERLAGALARHDAFTSAALRLARFGEESGRLAPLLAKAAHLEETSAQRALRALVGLLEPTLIVGFALVVAFVAAALLQAVYSVRPAGF
jgi:type II secretory pathway component PulF